MYQEKILQWYQKNKRDLPWRNTQDPWKIIVSEIMLQQTQVDRVLPKYLAFIEKFPTPKTCAQGSTSDILKLWQGLGYNSRGLRLKKLAEHYPLSFPRDAKLLQELPGIGPYTANAVLAFAFNKDVMVRDTNIERVLSRINNTHITQKEILEALPKGKSREWYNALMDLGATICSVQHPKCTLCPVQKECKNPTLQIIKTKQPKFEGSWRMYRGKLVRLLTQQDHISILKARDELHLQEEQFEKLIKELEQEGFIKKEKNIITLT